MEKNIAYACLFGSNNGATNSDVAIRWVNSDLSMDEIPYAYFEAESNRIAQVLINQGVLPGDVIAVFLPRSRELISIFFAILKIQAISCIMFSTLGDEALFDRLENSRARFIFTKSSLKHKVQAIRANLPELSSMIVIDLKSHEDLFTLSLDQLIAHVDTTFVYDHWVDPETPAFLQYTSGSTGKPKGALHVHGALADIHQSFQEIMQLEKEDVFWCTADPAWITGLVYGIIAPFVNRTRQVQFSGGYHAKNWLTILQQHRVNVWYTAPTALRMLMQEDDALFFSYDYSQLKRIYSVGEPLNPEIYFWGKKTFDVELYDTWFQSETGCIMVANRPGLSVKPGSMGIPRKEVDVIICDEKMDPLPSGSQGYLCVQSGWKSMFRTYLHNQNAYAQKFKDGVYITGDLALKDSEGYVWYISRADDVINTAGHLVGPFEIESVLLEIEEIVDVAVIGADDPLLHKKIIAYIKLGKDVEWSKELELRCRLHVQKKVSSTAIPSEFIIAERIPKNQSGKILRRVLLAWYEGKDPGDLSTME